MSTWRDQLQTDDRPARFLVRVQDRSGAWRRLPNVLSVSVERSVDSPAAQAMIEIANPFGYYSPDYGPAKFPHLALPESPWTATLHPGCPVRIYIGYGDDLKLYFTGVVDRPSINAADELLRLECRDNVALLQEKIIEAPIEYENMVASDILADLISRAGLTAVVQDAVIDEATSVLIHDDFEGVSDIPPAYLTDGVGWQILSGNGWTIVTSKNTAKGQKAGISRDVTLTRDGYVQFDYRVRANRLHFYVDGVRKATYKKGGWKTAQWQLTAGTHTLRWEAEDVGETSTLGRVVDIDDILVAEYTGGTDPYIVPYFRAEQGQTLWDEISRLAESIGYWVRAARDGSIHAGLWPEPAKTDPPKWVYTEYTDITDADYTLDGAMLRNKLVITSDAGTSTFKHEYLLNTVSNGRERVAYVYVPWATTHQRRKRVAENLFRQIARKFRRVQIVSIGNPEIDLADLVRLRERVTTAVGRYQVIGVRAQFDEGGYVDTVDLEYAP